MTVNDVLKTLDAVAPFSLQESWDNAGLMVGDPRMEVTGIIISLDITPEVIQEAIAQRCNTILSHHPLLFQPVRRLTPAEGNYPVIREAILNNLALIAVHTNADHQPEAINRRLAEGLGISKRVSVLKPLTGILKKLVTFVPSEYAIKVRQALFDKGAGHIGAYDSCSFTTLGKGTFRGESDTNPFAGTPGKFHTEPEERVEVIFPAYLQREIVSGLLEVHPYEEVAYDLYMLENTYPGIGAGIIGDLEESLAPKPFLERVKAFFTLPSLRYSGASPDSIRRVAICSGSGSFLIPDAIREGADAFLTGDLKYHTFQDEGRRLLLADIGHFESELVVRQWFYKILKEKFHTFAVLISTAEVHPVRYL